jgi:hypothetical protein
MASKDTYRVTLARAAQALGGAQALCKRLGVPMRDMTMWLEGKSTPPMHVFLRVIDILLGDSAKTAVRPLQPDEKPRKPK